MYPLRILLRQPVRTALTIGGVALCVVLMLFLLSVYRGVAEGSVEYIVKNRADLWVLRKNTTNILRGSSLLTTAHGIVLRQTPGIRQVAPVLLTLVTVSTGEGAATLFVAGFDPATSPGGAGKAASAGGPPAICEGRNVAADSEIVLDRCFARKHGRAVGDVIRMHDDRLTVVGFSSGTNAFVIQYGFTTLHRAQMLTGFPGIVTCYLVALEPGVDRDSMRTALADDLPGVEVFDHATFLQNNVREMESGFLPILYAIAAIGTVVLTSILSLLLAVIILESRKDFAVMRAIGSPDRFLRGIIFLQALLLSAGGTIVASLAFPPLASLIEWLSPEISTRASLLQVCGVSGVVLGVTLFSAWSTMRRLRSIYPLEAFA